MDEADLTAFMQAAKDRKLSTRDRKMLNAFQMTPAETGRDLLDSVSPAGLQELQTEINNTKDPKIKGILLEQQKKAMTLKNQIQMRATTSILSDLWNSKD